MKPEDTTDESKRLRVKAAESRYLAVRSQLSLAFTFCRMAETELRFGRIAEVHKLIQKIRHVADTVRLHIGEPKHVPREHVLKLYDELVELDSRLLQLEQRVTKAS